MELMSERTDEGLDEFRSEVTGRFNEVDSRFAEVDHRFDKVEQRLGYLDEKSDERFLSVSRRLDGVEGALQTQSAEWRAEIKELRADLKAGFEGIHRLLIQAGVVLGGALIGMVGAVLAVAII